MRLAYLALGLVPIFGCGGDGNKHLDAPDTTITSSPAALTNQAAATFEFTSDPAGTDFVCTVDGGAAQQCNSPFVVTVAEGDHTFAVAGFGLQAALDPTPATFAWHVDLTPPETTITSAPPAVDNTIAPMIVFAGSDTGGTGAVTFECALDAAAFAACTSPATISVTDGDHTFAVRATDAAGNVDATAATATWTVDTTTPDTMITAGPADGTTTGASTSFSFTSPITDATFECQLDAGAFAACTSPLPETALADGNHTFSVRAKDSHGVVDPTPASRTWIVDGTAPDVAITSTPTDPTNDNTPTFGFTSSDATATFECQIDGVVTFAACTSLFTGPAVSDGPHTFRVHARDAVGNVSTDATFTWTTDTGVPAVAITQHPADPTSATTATFAFTASEGTLTCSLDGGGFAACTSPKTLTGLGEGSHTFTVHATNTAGSVGSAAFTWVVDTTPPTVVITSHPNNPTNSTSATFAFTVSDGAIQCKLDGGGFATCASGTTFNGLGNGSHTFTVRSTDTAGNIGSASFTWTVDTAPPVVTITQRPTNPTSATTATFAFTVSDGAIECQLDGGAFATCTSPTTFNGLGDGSHTFTVRATDTAGNVGSASFTWVVDTTAPTVTITSHPNNPTNLTTAAFTFTISDGTASCTIDGGATACSSTSANLAGLGNGSHTFVVTATDTAGNVGSASFTWTVDTVAPTVTFTTTPPNPSTTAANLFAFTASDGALTCKTDGGVAATCASPTTVTLADGSHTFTVFATDLAGNVGQASFTWTIDTTPPVVAFDDVPPANWPVNYFDMKFHTTDATATLTCSLNGAAFVACASPFTITTVYGPQSKFSVRAKDPAGNQTTQTTSWTSTAGLVLAYQWEQGNTHNTSLLAQNPAYSPDGTVTLPVSGGWAGTALEAPIKHSYPKTQRPLSSSADGSYTASIWVRGHASSTGTIWTNATTKDGLTLTIKANTLLLELLVSGTSHTLQTSIPLEQWVNISVLSTGTGKGVSLLVNNNSIGNLDFTNGFDSFQASDLTVGAAPGTELDDLRFFNRALSQTELCTIPIRGIFQAAQFFCLVNSPGYELDFEKNLNDTGVWGLAFKPPNSFSFPATTLGFGLDLGTTGAWGLSGFSGQAPGQPEHSFTLWFNAASVFDTLIDFSRPCSAAGGGGTCSISVKYTSAGLVVTAGTKVPVSKSVTIPVNNGFHSVVVTEQKQDANNTRTLTIFVDGVKTVLDLGANAGNVYEIVSDLIVMPTKPGMEIDEYEFWIRDLSADPAMLCENGFDGEFNLVTQSCNLTSN